MGPHLPCARSLGLGGDGSGGKERWGSGCSKFWGKIGQNRVKSASPHHKSPGLARGVAVLAAAPPQLGWEARGPFRLGDRRQWRSRVSRKSRQVGVMPESFRVTSGTPDTHAHDHTCSSTRFPCRARSAHMALTRLYGGSGVPYRFPDTCTGSKEPLTHVVLGLGMVLTGAGCRRWV